MTTSFNKNRKLTTDVFQVESFKKNTIEVQSKHSARKGTFQIEPRFMQNGLGQ